MPGVHYPGEEVTRKRNKAVKKEICEQLYEKLVLYADGESEPKETAEITEHLERCKDCREMLRALRRSLQTAELIWGSGESETGAGQAPTSNMRNRRLMMRAALLAACLLIALGGAVIWWGQGEAVEPTETIKSGVTAAEVEIAAERTAVAAQMLAAADLLDEQPGGRNTPGNGMFTW